MPQRTSNRLAVLGAATVLLLGSLSGCSTFDKLRGEGFHDDLAKTGAALRPPGQEKRSSWFLSTKANEIDSHFGN